VTALYRAELVHVRRTPPVRRFRHRTHLWLVDLDHLPRQRLLARFEARDHLGDPAATIRANLDAWLARHGVDLAGGRVLMLANARVLGHAFNPLCVFWCHRPDGTLACVVAEVHNTYGERHCYLLDPDEHGRAGTAKELYVSPFQELGGDYVMRLPEPDSRLALAVTLHQHGETPFVATLRGTRTSGRLLVPALHQLLVSTMIRWHGTALWLRHVPIVPRPRHVPQKGVQ
jgi:DUF1365 family protein